MNKTSCMIAIDRGRTTVTHNKCKIPHTCIKRYIKKNKIGRRILNKIEYQYSFRHNLPLNSANFERT